MTLKSMTGFGRAEGALGTRRWHWEVRSVNGRGLDIRFRAPPGFESMEPRWREAIGKRVVRGSLNVSLNLAQEARGTEVRLNEATLAQVLRAAERVREMAGGEPPRVEALLGIKGVLETVEPEEGISEELQAALTETLERALAGLVQARGGPPPGLESHNPSARAHHARGQKRVKPDVCTHIHKPVAGPQVIAHETHFPVIRPRAEINRRARQAAPRMAGQAEPVVADREGLADNPLPNLPERGQCQRAQAAVTVGGMGPDFREHLK